MVYCSHCIQIYNNVANVIKKNVYNFTHITRIVQKDPKTTLSLSTYNSSSSKQLNSRYATFSAFFFFPFFIILFLANDTCGASNSLLHDDFVFMFEIV